MIQTAQELKPPASLDYLVAASSSLHYKILDCSTEMEEEEAMSQLWCIRS